MKEILAVFIGGGVGSVLRFLFTKFFLNYNFQIPFGTLLANTIACLIFGIFSGFIYTKLQVEPIVKLLILTGLCGGLSTFSTFNYELFLMLKNGQVFMSILYFMISFIVCLGSFAVFVNNQ